MNPIETLTRVVAAQTTLEQSLSALLDGLAERMAATSNDQNIHRLARALRAERHVMVQTILERAGAPAASTP